jgi:signal transduction histidine kinase
MAEQGGTISVAAKEDADAVVLEVTDSGRGVNSEEQTKLFEPFYSGFGSRPGVGLTLVKAMVEAHGGSIHCESQADHGATFHVAFPQQGTYQ